MRIYFFTAERHTGLYYYRQVALGHIIIPLRFAEQLLRIAYIWILVAVIKNDDRKKSKENKVSGELIAEGVRRGGGQEFWG